MPCNDRFWSDDDQHRSPVAPDPREPDPHNTVRYGQLRPSSRRALQDADLVPKSQDLKLENGAGSEHAGQGAKKRR